MVKEFPIPVDVIRERFGQPIDEISLDYIMEEGSYSYIREQVAIHSREFERKYLSIISVYNIVDRELIIRLLREMKEYLVDHNDPYVRQVAMQLMEIAFWFIYANQGPMKPYFHESDDESIRMAERHALLIQADNTNRLIIKYIEHQKVEWKLTAYAELFPSFAHIGQFVREMRQSILALSSKKVKIPEHWDPVMWPGAVYVGVGPEMYGYQRFKRMLNEDDPLDLMNLAIGSYHTLLVMNEILHNEVMRNMDTILQVMRGLYADKLTESLKKTQVQAVGIHQKPRKMMVIHRDALKWMVDSILFVKDTIVPQLQSAYSMLHHYHLEEAIPVLQDMPTRGAEFNQLLEKVQQL